MSVTIHTTLGDIKVSSNACQLSLVTPSDKLLLIS